MKLITLRKRREFLRIRGGGRAATHAFVLEAKKRESQLPTASPAPPPARPRLSVDATLNDALKHDSLPRSPDTSRAQISSARFGFTVTKKLGNAVRRNRIRRRLRAAVGEIANASAHGGARADFDYVLIARDAAHDMPFEDLTKLLANAFKRVHQKSNPAGPHGTNRSSDPAGHSTAQKDAN